MGNFFAELKRRNVYKVAVAYVVVSWLLIQAGSILFPTFDAPTWVMKVFVAALTLGFIPALILSWAFEITPEGIRRESEVAPGKSIARRTGRKIVAVTVVLAAVAASLLVFQLLRSRASSRPADEITSAPLTGSSVITEKSIAVLPFENLSSDKENAYFCEGVQDEILTRLARIADLKVISRTSTQRFSSAPENLPEIAKRLGVTNILEGSVQKANEQVRVNVQLINARNDAHLWAETYDRQLSDIFAVESEIAKIIAERLQARLTGHEEAAIAARPTESSEAYQLYLQGRFYWNKRNAADLDKSIDYFQRALTKDPGYALAYAGLAQSWMLFPPYKGDAPADYYPKAAEAARKALELDNNLSEAITALASFKAVYEFDLPGAAADYERALQLNPNDATARHWYATDVLAFTGQRSRELAEMKRALELDPLSRIINVNLAVAYMDNGRLDEALAQLRAALKLDNTFSSVHWHTAQVLSLKGNLTDAMAECAKAPDDQRRLGLMGYLYGLAGRAGDARQALEQLRQSRAQHYTLAYSLALASIGANDKAGAINWLEQSYADHDGENIGRIRVDPLLSSLHGDPRFEALAEKIVPLSEFRKQKAK